MNTQEVIELLNLQERQAKQEVIKKFQVDKATILRRHANDKYDLSNGMVNIQPLDTSKKFSEGDSVFLQIPAGDKQQTKIVARSNIKTPEEELYEYGEEPVKEGTIYLACPDEGVIRPYSLSGTAGTDLSPGSCDYICTDDTWIYTSFRLGYSLWKIKIDGTEETMICSETYYNYIYGLAVDPSSTYLYTASDNYIVRIKINYEGGEDVEITWKEMTEFTVDSIKDLCGDGSYLYILNNVSCMYDNVAVYDFSGNFIRNIETSGIYKKIYSDEMNIYLNSNDSNERVDIFTISGVFVRSIEGAV
jgi:hypothetical protein